MSWLAVILAAVLAGAAAWTRYWPWGRCPACRDRKGRGIGSTDEAFNRCRWCGGSGEQIRPLARIWPRHRATARRLRKRRSRR